jgi:hypothetical protein
MRSRVPSLALAILGSASVCAALGVRLDAATATAAAAPVDPKTKPPKAKPPAAARDCDDATDRDRDLDGHLALECGGDDCDDGDAHRFPGIGRERCGGELPDGRKAMDHDEDCNPCTVAGAAPDGDRDRDGRISAACANPFVLPSAPAGCDERELRLDTPARRVRGGDCDDLNAAVRPGTQICAAAADSVSLCLPTAGFKMLPTSAAGPGASIDASTGFATVKCPAGSACFAQPDGTGSCQK